LKHDRKEILFFLLIIDFPLNSSTIQGKVEEKSVERTLRIHSELASIPPPFTDPLIYSLAAPGIHIFRNSGVIIDQEAYAVPDSSRITNRTVEILHVEV